jgi:hypothetical protein
MVGGVPDDNYSSNYNVTEVNANKCMQHGEIEKYTK